MWKWGSGDDSPSKTVAAGSQDASSMSVTDLTDQLTSTEQLVTQLKELVREKDAELRNKDLQLKEEKESADAKLSKLKLQNKAKVASLTSQLEELKKQLAVSGGSEARAEQKKASKDGDQENAAANRGKILVLRRRIEELESQITQKNEELRKKSVELEAQRCRGAEMDAMLAEKEKKLAERDAYIIDLQTACGSSGVANEIFLPNEELKNQLAVKESSLQSMQVLVQNLTKKVGDSEEKCSLFQEQIESLKNMQSKERERFQGKEATYMENVRLCQNIIHEKEKELQAQREKHEQELFKLAAKSDASADLEQLLKALKQKLHEKEEVMLGRTQVIDVLQKELDAKDQQLKEINENLKRLLSEKENLQSKLDAEKHVMRAQLRDMMEKHELEMTKVKEKYNAELHEIQEKHETELQEKDQALFQLKKQVEELSGSGQTKSKEDGDLESITKEKMEDLEVKLKTEEFSSKNNDVSALNSRISELEIENEELQSKLQSLHEIRTQNEELLTKLEVYEEQQRKLQADLDQVTKRAASQASESGSVDELQSQLLEWQENVQESEELRDPVREEKSAMALRMAQIEEEREAMVSGEQELEEELTTVQGMGRLQQARRKSNQTNRKLQEEYNFDRKQCFQELNTTLDSTDSAEGENMGGLRSVVEELELERNQLQEQILFLEERCQDLEDRFQLQGRMEALQNENERLQTQLTQLRNQQKQDMEKHQILISSLNEQLKGLSDRNSFLENSLGEKEVKLLSTTEKLEQIETLRKLLQEKDLLNKELGEKFVHAEQKLNEALKKCSVYEVENTEQKTVISDLTEKVATLKEKTLKQDSVVELMQLDLDQTNEELDKLNTSHLEERSQLIQDLQKREREIDNLKEALAEKDREMSVLSLNMTEYSEQVIILKHQVQCKEEEIRGMEEALSKAERETHLLKEVQTADVRDASLQISALSEQTNAMRLELERIRVENEVKTKENEELIRQSSENSLTIKDLRSEIKANSVAYRNKLAECESQITLLKEQISKSSEKLQETENKQRKETEYLKSQLEESNTLKEKWNNLIKEKENKAQTLENELQSIRDSYNKLVLENARKDEELAELSRKLIEHTEHQETIKKELQEKQEFIISLEKKLGVMEQQNEQTRLKLTGDLKAKETCCKELNNQLNEIHEQMNKLEMETQEKASANKQLQADLEGKEEKLAEQIKANEYLKKSIDMVEKEKEQLISEKEDLSKLLDVKECELLKKIQAVAEIESKLSVSTAESLEEKILLNDSLCKEMEESKLCIVELQDELKNLKDEKTNLSHLIEERDLTLKNQGSELEKLHRQVSENMEESTALKNQLQLLSKELDMLRHEKEDFASLLSTKSHECEFLQSQLAQQQSEITSARQQAQTAALENNKLKVDIETVNVMVMKKSDEVAALTSHLSQQSHNILALKDQIDGLLIEKENLKTVSEEKETLLSEKEALIQQMKDSKLAGEGQYMQIISDLQNQIQALGFETSQLRQTVQEKENEFKRQAQELKLLKDKSEESDEKQLKLLASEAEQLKMLVSEKELTINNISLFSENLKMQLQGKEKECEVLKKQVVELEEAKVTLQREIQHQKNVVIEMDQSLSEKESSLKENDNLLKTLKEKARKDEERTVIISELQNQVHELTQELQKSKELIHEKEHAFLSLQEKLEAQYELRTELNAALGQKEEVIAGLINSLKDKDASMQLTDSNVNVLSSEVEILREKLEKSDTAVKNLTEEIQEKNEKVGINQKKIDSLTGELDSLKKEHQKALDQISTWGEQLQQKESSVESLRVKCSEQADNIARLKLELDNINSKSSQDCHDNALLVAGLQCQVESLEKEKNLLQADVDKLMVENTQLAASQNDLQKKLEELREINEKLETSENYSRMQIDAVKLQMKTEKEKLQMQVSVKGEELSKLELKLETLEQSLLESENKWVTELDRATLQNNNLTEQLSSLESEMESKDSKIQSLQQELDLIKEELTQSLSPLLSSRLLCKEKAAQASDCEQQLTDSKIQLEKISTLITTVLSKETEGEQLQLLLLEKQKEIDTVKEELKSMQSLEKQKELLQNDIEMMKGKYESEIECLSKEMVTVKETLCKQQSLLQEREESFAEVNKQVELLQDKINKSEEVVRTSQEKLHIEGKKVASLLEEMGEKDQLIENLTSQVNQQKDLVSGLSQQLKEKDSSVTQIMESLSNEMLNFSEERNMLNTKLQDLEAVHSSSVGQLTRVLQELEDCKKELEHSQVTLSSREAVFKDLMHEKEQMQFDLEKIGKEKENLKKKLQAALIIRRDLIQKVGKLEKSGQEEIEKEQKKAGELLKEVNELTDKLKVAEVQNKEFESHLGTLKQQLLERDAKISDLTENLSSKASYLKELQDRIAELNDVIAEKQNLCEQNLKSLEEKDCVLAHMQSMLDGKARVYEEERSQLLLALEKVKSEVKKEELLKDSSAEEPGLSAGDRKKCLDPNIDINVMNQLKKEKEALQRELLVREEDRNKFQKEREEHIRLAADFDEQKNQLEQLKQEHKALWEVLQTKCKELDLNQLDEYPLGKELASPKAVLGEAAADLRNLESDKPSSKVQTESLKETQDITLVANKDTELIELRNNYAKLQEETEMLRKELRKISVEFSDEREETVNLHSSRQQEQCKGSLLEDIKQLQKKLKAYEAEAIDIKTELVRVSNEKEALIKKCEEGYKLSQEKLQKLRSEAKKEVAEKNEEIAALRCSLTDFKYKLDLEKELLNKTIKESQEETLHYKTALEEMKSEKEKLLSCLEKSDLEVTNMRKEVEHFSGENKKLLTELCMLREKAEMSRPAVASKELKEDDTKQVKLPGKGAYFQLSETDFSGKTKLREATECQIQKQMQVIEEPLAKTANENDSKPQEQRTAAEEKSRERLQRKLQAALISRKEALRENKCLKDQLDKLMLEREELVNKTGMLEHLVELGREKQSSSTVSPLSEKEHLASENARLLTENENLTAACESLKSTMETIVQEKEAFSFQLNTLKDSQTVELTGWKAKHSELKQEYESLLQAYENISSKIADMRQVIDLSRKEKQEAIQRLREGESEKEALEKHLQKLVDENEVIKNQLKQLGESKKMEVDELQSKAERQIREQEARMQEHQDRLHELTKQNHQLMEENEQLKQTSENLKQALEKIQNENDILHNNITVTKAALGELQVQMEVHQNDMQSKISEALFENESLLKDINALKDKLSEKEQDVFVLEQERNLDMECKSLTQEIVSLNEKVKILEDDKCLLQEELENVQESSYKVKNEREFLETELLNHVKKVDHLTDRMKLAQEKVKSAQRDNNGSKNKTKELQELLKEKQQEINHLQKDSIKFQELILDLERSVKLSQSKSEKFEKDLSNMSEKLAKSNEELHHLKGKLSSQANLLDQSKNEVDRLTDENLNWRKELKKKDDELQIQKREYERQLEFNLQQLKLVHKRDFLNLEERHGALEREKDRALSEVHGLQEEISIKDSENKKLQADLNAALARLAAFTKCMSSLQDDRDRVITEMKTWEMQFKEIIQKKEKQVEDSNKRIISLQDELKEKITQIQELNIKYSVVEETKDELYLRQKSVDRQRYEELCRIKEENAVFLNRQQELESVLQSKEAALQALLKENNSLNHLIANSKSAGKEIKALESNFTRQEQELQQLIAEKEKLNAELQKQTTISEQMKIMLNNKDKEISLLISLKGDEISDYLSQVQTQHRKQIEEYDLQLRSLQLERQQSEESCQRMQNELRSLQVKADKEGQDKAAIASEIDALKKSMSSLQNDRDDLFTKYKELEHLHQDVLNQKDSLLVGNASENNALKEELRMLLNQIDDLHSENAMLSAQLLKYREDLNQVLSLKDHQLKDLLKQKLDCIKSLEQEKYDLQKQIKEVQLSSELQKDIAVSLEHENKKLVSKVNDLESLIASLNKEKLVSRSGEKLVTSDSVQNQEGVSNGQYGENLQELQKSRGRNTRGADEEYSNTLLMLEHGDEPDAFAEKMILEVQSQNTELRSQNEAFGKAMTALQNDRDRIIEELKALQSKYSSDLQTEKKKGDELEAELDGFKLHLVAMLKDNSLLNRAIFDAADKVTLDQIAAEIGKLCRTLVSREMEVSRLSAECGSYVHQIEAFSKAMASLQDDRDKLLQELSNQKVTSETKQGTASFPIGCNSISELNSLKSNLDMPQNNRGVLAKEGASLAAVEISKLKTKVDDLEKALHQTKAFQAETEREIASYQNELAGLRMEKNLLLSESQALRNQCQITVAEKDQQIAQLQKLQQDMIMKKSISAGSNYPVQVLETVSLAGSADMPGELKCVLAEKNQLQNELQRCLQEIHQKDLHFQQMNSKVVQSTEENAVLSAQLKTLSQTLRDNQLRYTDLQNRYSRLEREYQTMQVTSFQGTVQDETRAEVPPGAPRERSAVIVEVDNMELNELRKRLAETEQQYDSVQQALTQLTETLSEEKRRREAAEEALGLSEEQSNRFEVSSYRAVPSEYTVQMEAEEEREALIINPSEHVVVRKVRGALSIRRWLRGRSLYCSKLLTSRAKSRYLFLTYLVTLHLVVLLCLTGVL
ncbi:PREDICTED: golgin subfamily B member 1-like [Nestor notabilis]|uniref:golgin subfamily B member 1-like n=1 Tax=Nestor notabilis TaxID=176057 RepID=UPI0005233792|nr:PREDICTED: golgin subfamily B member 1-like [Nestor notabilis]